ncbi:MarR family winged helix-turn-helix transcriptional regulator [Undibacterium arcticum]|uniref:MarR family winged helix-turn-helix transcriptional regulator n=2 Tax=Undibacterium arcticum TaxID=1762892 RepID=A0ABV7FAJ6_9BURK
MSEIKSNPFEDFRIEDSVGYLLARSRTMLAKAIDAALAEHNITHAQGSILIRLATGKSTTAADFARELYIDAASMTRMIDRLEKRGLLAREPNPDDRRQFKLRLTNEGTTLAEKLPALYTATLNRSFSGFSAEELGFLKYLLRKLLANCTLSDEKNN